MANTQADIDEAFLNYVLERNIISPLEAETCRSELRRKKTTQKQLTMQTLLVHKGLLTQDKASAYFDMMMQVLSQPTLLPDEDETGRAPASNRRPTPLVRAKVIKEGPYLAITSLLPVTTCLPCLSAA